jgi:CBS domain-containing protein
MAPYGLCAVQLAALHIDKMTYKKGVQKTKVGKIIQSHIVSISPTTKVHSALRLLETSNLSLLPVIDENRLVGIVTGELLRENVEPQIDIGSIMMPPLFVEKEKSVDYAIRYIIRHNIGRVPVVESNIAMKCIGIVTAPALLKAKRQMQ